MFLSYNQILQLNRSFANAHHVLKNFGNGMEPEKVLHDQEEPYRYPLMWMEDLPGPILPGQETTSFRVWFLAPVEMIENNTEVPTTHINTNKNEVKSDMKRCAQDFLSYWVQQHDYPKLKLEQRTTINFVEDTSLDSLWGCYVEVNFIQVFTFNTCAIPMGIPITIPSNCTPSFVYANDNLVFQVSSGGKYEFEIVDTNGIIVGVWDSIDQKFTVPSAGSGASIDIELNSVLVLEDITNDININVINTDNDEVGSWNGLSQVIGDCEQTFNGDPLVSQPAENEKEIIVQTIDAAQIGSVITDTSTQTIIEIPNAEVNVNGDAFESVSPSVTLNVPILDTLGNPVGSNIGPSIEINNSDVSVNSNLLIPIPSEQSKSILILDAIDSDPVALNILTNTSSLAEIQVPNGLVRIKDSSGFILHNMIVKSGGTIDQIVSDSTVTLKNTIDDTIAIHSVKAEELKDIISPDTQINFRNTPVTPNPSGVDYVVSVYDEQANEINCDISHAIGIMDITVNPTNIIYIRPANSGYGTTTYLVGDEGYNELNFPAPNQAKLGVPALLNPLDPKKLIFNNVFGHKERFTGINGGYFDYSTLQFKLANGSVSTQDITFGTVALNTSYMIDHHTGIAWKWNGQSSGTWSAKRTEILSLSHAGFSDWILASRNQYNSIFAAMNLSLATTSVRPFNITGNLKSSTPTFGLETTNHHYASGITINSNRSDGITDGAYACRWHF
ncbi:MAG: hypothetical protein ACRCYO_13390 [Bacteroidia bacterium]